MQQFAEFQQDTAKKSAFNFLFYVRCDSHIPSRNAALTAAQTAMEKEQSVQQSKVKVSVGLIQEGSKLFTN